MTTTEMFNSCFLLLTLENIAWDGKVKGDKWKMVLELQLGVCMVYVYFRGVYAILMLKYTFIQIAATQRKSKQTLHTRQTTGKKFCV